VAVTGGAGFIGSNLARKLLRDGHEVVIIDDLSTGLIQNLSLESLEFHKVSITDSQSIHKILEDCETIFHFAARGSIPRSIENPLATHEVNSTGTINILEVARHTGAHVIFSSSSSVYGRNKELPKDENMWLGPLNPYAASKLASEAYLEGYSSSFNLNCTILRLFNVFGPMQRPDHRYAAVIPKWIWSAIKGEPIEVYGDGHVSRDFTYVETVVEVASRAMTERIAPQGAVNLAYGNRIFLSQLIEILHSYFPYLEVKYLNERVGDVKESQNSPRLIKELFPTVHPKPFEEALDETINWLKEHGPKNVARSQRRDFGR
jgi:UDP-glucose 4-epimerase